MTDPGTIAMLLLLGDARLPAGAHAHSGGAEQAVAAGIVEDEATLAGFLEGRLETGVALEAHAAASACRLLAGAWTTAAAGPAQATAPEGRLEERLEALEVDLDARLVAPAARASSRRQGAHHLAATRRIVPSAALETVALLRADPHLCVSVGAASAGVGLSPAAAAATAAYQSLAGAASAALRLLGLDPVAVSALLARLAPACEDLAAAAGAAAEAGEALPALAAPGLDRLMEQHRQRKDRLFAS